MGGRRRQDARRRARKQQESAEARRDPAYDTARMLKRRLQAKRESERIDRYRQELAEASQRLIAHQERLAVVGEYPWLYGLPRAGEPGGLPAGQGGTAGAGGAALAGLTAPPAFLFPAALADRVVRSWAGERLTAERLMPTAGAQPYERHPAYAFPVGDAAAPYDHGLTPPRWDDPALLDGMVLPPSPRPIDKAGWADLEAELKRLQAEDEQAIALMHPDTAAELASIFPPGDPRRTDPLSGVRIYTSDTMPRDQIALRPAPELRLALKEPR